jgi:hypothetical protein
MSRRKIIVSGVLASTIALAVGLVWFAWSSGAKSRFDRIKVGMSLAEVEALLGKSDLNSLASGTWQFPGEPGMPDQVHGRMECWLCPDGREFMVIFDHDGMVAGKGAGPPKPIAWRLHRLRKRIGL